MIYPQPVFIVGARRTAIGRFGGALRAHSPVELALPVARSLVPEGLRPAVGQVVLGQMLPAGGGMNVARQLGLRLGLREEMTGFTVNMACASGLKAVLLAADRLASGAGDLALAGGVESMSRAPHYAPDVRWGKKLGDSVLVDALAADGLSDPVLGLAMGETAERVAAHLGISREEQDRHALASHRRAVAARAEMAREIVSVPGAEGELAADEAPRADTSVEKLARLQPVFRPDGTVTAGNASTLADGAALVLLASEESLARHGLKPRARIIMSAVAGTEPVIMLTAPGPAAKLVLKKAGMTFDDIDLFEVNEAFAAVVLKFFKDTGVDPAKVNVNGGAMALGHPIGATGAMLIGTLVDELERQNKTTGLITMCTGGGMGTATIIERI